MKFSIKLRLFAIMSGLIVFYVLLSWFLNNQFLDKYYFYNKKNMLIDNYKLINSLYKGNMQNISSELEKLEYTQGLHILIVNKNFETQYDSFATRKDPKPPQERDSADKNYPQNVFRQKRELINNKKVIIEKTRVQRFNSDFMNLYSLLNNGDYLYLGVGIAPIQENVNLANNFFLFTGFLTILLGSVIVFVIAGRFTKPILELKDIAQAISVLDFSKKYPVQTSDEIGELGNSINSVSEQLEKSISELQQANRKLKEDIQKERKVDEMRKEFIANVSHELKTPIAMIQGYAEGLKVNVNEDEENKNFYCEVIIDEAAKMNRLVKQFLGLAQIESGTIKPEKVDFDIVDFIEHIIRKNAIIIKEKNIDITIEGEKSIWVNADMDMIEQVFTNYLNNAVNHVDENRKIKNTIYENQNKVVVSVFNSGQHIPEESLEHIWTSFYKVDKARTRAYGGTGIGLAVVKAIQEENGNQYGVKNVSHGVEFWFDVDAIEL